MSNEPATPTPTDSAKRRRTLLRWSIVVAVGAVLIILVGTVGPVLLGQRGSQQPTATAAHDRSEQLRSQAEALLASGETTAALVIAQSAVDADPANTAARALVDRISGAATAPAPTSTTTANPPSSSTTTTPNARPRTSPDAGYLQPVSDMAALIPTAYAGWSFDQPLKFEDNVSVSASPEKAAAAGQKLQWTVRDEGSPAKARDFAARTSKRLYSKHPATVTVHGVSARYGTDGGVIASITYTRGRYVFELLFSTSVGRAAGVRAASAFRDTPVQ